MMDFVGPAGVVERWQPELDRIAPETERGHSSLVLQWEPGEEWCPVNRWTIWETMRLDMAPDIGIREDLRGPNPRDFGRWDSVTKRFVSTRRFTVTQAQWLFYRRTGLYGRAVWVVQGRNGGHKRFWSDVEQNIAMMTYGESFDAMGIGADALQPPAPGELDYAEPDMRTIEKLAGIDMVRRFGSVLHKVSRNVELGSSLDLRERQVAEEMARQVFWWLDEQVSETLDLITRAQASEGWEYADPDALVLDPDQERENFITNTANRVL